MLALKTLWGMQPSASQAEVFSVMTAIRVKGTQRTGFLPQLAAFWLPQWPRSPVSLPSGGRGAA